MADIGSLVIKVGANIDGWKSSMAEASLSAERFANKIADSVSQGVVLFDQYGRTVQTATAPIEKLVNMNEQLAAASDRVIMALGGQSAETEKLATANTHAVSEIQATSGALRTLEGNGGIRAAERFIATTLGLGSAMQAIFVPIGALALASAIGRIGKELIDVTENFFLMRDAEKEVEAIGVEMAKSAEAAIVNIGKLQVEALRARGQLVAAAKRELADLVNKPIQLPSLSDPERKKKLSGLDTYQNQSEFKAVSAVYSEVLPADIPARIQQINEGIARTSEELLRIKNAGFDPTFLSTHYASQAKDALELYGYALQSLQIKQQEFAAEAGKASADIGKAQIDEQKKREETVKQATELLRRQSGDLRQADEQDLAELKAHGVMSVGTVIQYWQERLSAESANSQRVREIQITLGSLYQEQEKVIQRVAERGAKLQEEQAKKAEAWQAKLESIVIEGEQLAEKIQQETAKVNAELGKIGVESQAQANAHVLALQRLADERAYGLQIDKTAQAQIAYQQQILALDQQESGAKIRLLQQERDLETDAVKRGQVQNRIQQEQNRAHQQEYAALTRIGQLQTQDTARWKLQALAVNTVHLAFNQLSQGIASAIVHAKNFGSAMLSIVQSIGQSIIQGLIGAALGGLEKALVKHVAQWLGFKFLTSKMNVMEVGSDAAVAAAAAYASIAAIPIIGPALAPEAAALAYSDVMSIGPLAAYEKGGLVPETMLALVHKGEWVTPAAQVAQGITGPRSGRGSGNNVTLIFPNVKTTRQAAGELARYLKTAGGPMFSPGS